MTDTSRTTTLRVWVYCLLFVMAESGIWYSYRHHDARFHWFAHFFTGASAALLVMSVIAWRTHRAARFPLLWILLAHLYAMFPDVLFAISGSIHKAWMDLFLWHISIHFMPGRNVTNYGMFLLALAIYLTTIRTRSEVKVAR